MATQQDIKAAADEQARYEARAAELQAELENASRELQAAESTSGAEVLDEPQAAAKVVEGIAALKVRVEVARKAQAEAHRRAHAARVRGVELEAEALEPTAVKARKALAAHVAKRDELLTALQEFSRAEWRMRTSFDEDIQDRIRRGETVELDIPIEWELQTQLDAIEEQQQALRGKAASIAADPSWVDPQERRRAAHQARWVATVEQYRGFVAELEELGQMIEDTGRAVGIDPARFPWPLDDPGLLRKTDPRWSPRWLYEMRKKQQKLHEKIGKFSAEIEFFRRKAALGYREDAEWFRQLVDAQSDALLVEFGLKEPEPDEDDEGDADAQLPVGA